MLHEGPPGQAPGGPSVVSASPCTHLQHDDKIPGR